MNHLYSKPRQVIFILAVFCVGVLGYNVTPQIAHASSTFDSNNLIEDSSFIAIDSMSVADIQNFLNTQGGFLKSFSEGGRSASQIIYDAAHGHGDAANSGGTPINGILVDSSTGTVSPRVILVTLQKEQGLLNMPNQNTDSINAAMGYGCPDSGGCNSAYTGFTKQVENGAWQLRYNYERASGHGLSDYQVGQSMTFSDYNGSHSATFSNRATASLYRYTPHVYNGNYNFWYLNNAYFPSYNHQFISENAYPSLGPGDSYNFVLIVKNTGGSAWDPNIVHLATDRSRDRITAFAREGDGPSGWVSANRIKMQESSVAPGENATFSFWMRNDGLAPGTYHEYFRLAADGAQWMEDYGIYWDVKVISSADKYHYSFVSQNAYPTLGPNDSYDFTATVKNTGTTTWQKGVVNLATDRSRDRVSTFTRGAGWTGTNRIAMQENSVAPGENATYTFSMKNGGVNPGTYHEYFRLVADGITWMEDYGIYWDVKALSVADMYHYSFVSENAYPTLNRGKAYNFILSVKNSGTATWQKGVVNLATDRDRDRVSAFTREGDGPSGWLKDNRITMQEDTVAPGQTATFSFWMKNDGVSSGVHNEYFRLVADGITWMEDYGIYWGVVVP